MGLVEKVETIVEEKSGSEVPRRVEAVVEEESGSEVPRRVEAVEVEFESANLNESGGNQ